VNPGFNGHEHSVASGGPPNKPLQPTSGASSGRRPEAIVRAARG
jgi:hypothetical protein